MYSIPGLYSFGVSVGLYSVGLFIGFILAPYVVRKQIVSEKEGMDLDQTYDQLFLAYKFVDELDEAPDSCLTEEELLGLRDKVLHYEIPYVNQKIILFYDHKKGGFSYYANSGIIYKYLNVAARKYVLDYGCKQVFKEMVPSMKKEEKTVTSSQFVPKVGKTFLEKDLNQYHYLGTFQDFDRVKNPVEHKKIDYIAYMKLLESINSEPTIIPEPVKEKESEALETESEREAHDVIPEKGSRILDFLRQFSSTPKSQSIKID